MNFNFLDDNFKNIKFIIDFVKAFNTKIQIRLPELMWKSRKRH